MAAMLKDAAEKRRGGYGEGNRDFDGGRTGKPHAAFDGAYAETAYSGTWKAYD